MCALMFGVKPLGCCGGGELLKCFMNCSSNSHSSKDSIACVRGSRHAAKVQAEYGRLKYTTMIKSWIYGAKRGVCHTNHAATLV